MRGGREAGNASQDRTHALLVERAEGGEEIIIAKAGERLAGYDVALLRATGDE